MHIIYDTNEQLVNKQLSTYRYISFFLAEEGGCKQSSLSNYYNIIITRKFGKKIWAKRESGLTTVQLKGDPPVTH